MLVGLFFFVLDLDLHLDLTVAGLVTSLPICMKFSGNVRSVGPPDYSFGQFRETARFRDAQHGGGVCCALAPQLVSVYRLTQSWQPSLTHISRGLAHFKTVSRFPPKNCRSNELGETFKA